MNTKEKQVQSILAKYGKALPKKWLGMAYNKEGLLS
jgi:hypothetical protein